MIKKALLAASLLAVVVILAVYFSQKTNLYLFQRVPWLLIPAVSAGMLAGILRVKAAPEDVEGKPSRHTIDSFLQHWGTAVGLFLMVVSGFRLSGSIGLLMTNLHFMGLVYALGFGSYFITAFFASGKHEVLLPDVDDIVGGTLKKYLLHRPWTETGKYLSSQKAAFLTFIIIGSEILISGGVKVAAKFWLLPSSALDVSTMIHDVSAVLFVVMVLVHVLMTLVVPAHRRLILSWFTGRHGEHAPEPSLEVEPAGVVAQEAVDMDMSSPE
jgi:cytochrome b subunit of formate dehydrogenase